MSTIDGVLASLRSKRRTLRLERMAVGTNQRSQITMSDGEVATFLEQHRTATMATLGPNGAPHLVAMWYAVIDGAIWFETKTKSQKVQNLRRDPHIACMVEDGWTYDRLRGVSVDSTVASEPLTNTPVSWFLSTSEVRSQRLARPGVLGLS